MRILLLAIGCFAVHVHAAYTPVDSNGNGAERCLVGSTCGAGAYAGAPSIVAAFERDLGLAPGSLQRIDDAYDKRWSVLAPDAAVRPFARYGADNSILGLSSGGGFSALSSGRRKAALKNERVLVEHPSLFRRTREHGEFRRNTAPWLGLPAGATSFAFALHNLSSSLYLSSDTSLRGFANSGLPQDWMVTYRVPGQDLYLIAWEDRTSLRGGRPSDFDYNDLVFLVRGAAPLMAPIGEPAPTPLPSPLLGFLAGLGSLALFWRRRR